MSRLLDIRGFTFVHSKGKLICLDPIFLDIETSNNHAENVEDLITWISSIQVVVKDHYYLFRTPEELIQFYKTLYEELDLIQEPPHVERRIYTFIHNNSYDLSYLIPYFMEYLPTVDGEPQGIIEGNNQILTYCQGCLEFRCTYRLTQMSLAKWTNVMKVEHIKQVGLYDYDKTIYQDQELTDQELLYDRNDVLGMSEALDNWNRYYNDTVATMPLTSTGYVRRDLRKSCAKNKYYRDKFFIKNKLDNELYYCYLKSFGGGYTHNNRFYKDITIKVGNTYKFFNEEIKVHNIGHRDFKSHYPSQMTCYKFPVGVPQVVYDVNVEDPVLSKEPMDISKILAYYPNFYTMTIIRIRSAVLRDKRISMPFMQYSKCHEKTFTDLLQDNGRIVKASGSWIMFLDNLTLQILDEQYKMEYDIIKVWKIKAGYLPPELTDVVDKYFKGKSDKKNLVKQLEDLYGRTDQRCYEAQFDLLNDKKMLNSIYGCCATNPLRTTYRLDKGMMFKIDHIHSTLDDMQTGLDKFYSKYNNFLAYQIGCTVTALAKFELYQFIKAIGYKKILYCDTDSAFYIKDSKTEKAIEKLNALKHETAKYVVLDNGQKEYYDAFEPEPDCIAFRGLHSKCYGVVTAHGLELTIAGVPAKTIVGMKDGRPVYVTREQELQGSETDPIKALDKLTDDFTFTVNTGATACYIGATGGRNGLRAPTMVEVDGHIVSTAGGCVIKKLKEKKVHDTEYDYSWEYLDMTQLFT